MMMMIITIIMMANLRILIKPMTNDDDGGGDDCLSMIMKLAGIMIMKLVMKVIMIKMTNLIFGC